MCRWLALLLWIPGLGPLWAQTVVINELVSSNHTGLEDEDGDRSDWIELYNPGAAAINLAGYGISDEAKSPFKWRFPRRLLAARDFLVVFASGKDRTNSTRLHTSFRLASSGEMVILSRPDGQEIDRVKLPGLPTDIAFGRQPDGAATLLFLATPSPAAPNISASGDAALRAPTFSQPAGFYANSLMVELHAPDPDTRILYTLDGSEPNALSSHYEHPFSLVDRSPEPNGISLISGTSTNNQHTDGWKAPKGLVRKITVLRARAFRDGALPSPTVGHSYAVGLATNAGLPVISLSLAPESLFDFDRGIYMLGRVFTDWRRSHPSEVLTGHTPANYTQRGPDWERPALLEYFDPAGTPAFSRDVRLDIQGQSSRSFRQKSLGIKTVAGAIPYEIFPGLRRHGDGTPLQEFQHLRLRNSGNDWAYTLFRDALCHRLAEGLGFDTEAYRPVIVFLNGEYWGIHNLREQHDADYLHSHYDVPKGQAVICAADGSLVEGPPNANQSFLELRHYLETHDLSVPANYEWVTRQIDVRNFIRYHAACVYFGNADWPHNNLQVWRDLSGPQDGGAGQPRDGRWRWLLFDCDLAYGHPWSGGVSDPTLATVLSPEGRADLGGGAGWSTIFFRSLMANPGFRREFINTSAGLLNSWFREARALTFVEGMRSALAPAMHDHFDRWQTQSATNNWATQVKVLSNFASQRPIVLRQQFVTQLHLAGYAPLTLAVSNSAAGQVRVNQLWINSQLPGVGETPYPWHGWYFRGIPLEIEAQPAPGWEFAGWEVSPTSPTFPRDSPRVQLTLADPTILTAIFRVQSPRFLNVKGSEQQYFTVEMEGLSRHRYRVQASSDLKSWSDSGSLLTDDLGRGSFRWEVGVGGQAGYLRLTDGWP